MSEFNPEERKRIVDDALKCFKEKHAPEEQSDLDRLMERAKDITRRVSLAVKQHDFQVRNLGNNHDPAVLGKFISELYLNEFSSWRKDDLLMLLVLMHTEVAVGQVI